MQLRFMTDEHIAATPPATAHGSRLDWVLIAFAFFSGVVKVLQLDFEMSGAAAIGMPLESVLPIGGLHLLAVGLLLMGHRGLGVLALTVPYGFAAFFAIGSGHFGLVAVLVGTTTFATIVWRVGRPRRAD